MANTCVVGDAVRYIKQLQEKVQTLEEEQRQRQPQEVTKQEMESVVVVKRSQVVVEDDKDKVKDEDEDEDEDEDKASHHEEQRLPEIEARVYKENILLKIECEKRKGLLVKILSELERLNLGVANINVASFGGVFVDITIIAEMEKEFRVPVKDMVRALSSALQAAP